MVFFVCSGNNSTLKPLIRKIHEIYLQWIEGASPAAVLSYCKRFTTKFTLNFSRSEDVKPKPCTIEVIIFKKADHDLAICFFCVFSVLPK